MSKPEVDMIFPPKETTTTKKTRPDCVLGFSLQPIEDREGSEEGGGGCTYVRIQLKFELEVSTGPKRVERAEGTVFKLW